MARTRIIREAPATTVAGARVQSDQRSSGSSVPLLSHLVRSAHASDCLPPRSPIPALDGMLSACYQHSMSNLQVKDVPDALHDELRRRAERSGRTIREYVLELIRRDLATPSREEWLATVRALSPLDLGGSASALVTAARTERARRGRRR